MRTQLAILNYTSSVGFEISIYDNLTRIDVITSPSYTFTEDPNNLSTPFLNVQLEVLYATYPTVGVIIGVNNPLTHSFNFPPLFGHFANSFFSYFDDLSLFNYLGITSVSPLSSLNGNGSELIDGTEVTVDGRSTLYTVDRSYMGLVQDNSYTAFYDLTALNGSKLTVPESLLTQYVAPIIAP